MGNGGVIGSGATGMEHGADGNRKCSRRDRKDIRDEQRLQQVATGKSTQGSRRENTEEKQHKRRQL